MTTTRNSLFRPLALGAALTCMGAAAFAGAPNPNAYLNGTYMAVNFDANPESDQLSITFDGAGNYSGTDNNNTGGVITSNPMSGTYAVASDGTFTVNAGSELITGDKRRRQCDRDH
jgi:hypothetical protein